MVWDSLGYEGSEATKSIAVLPLIPTSLTISVSPTSGHAPLTVTVTGVLKDKAGVGLAGRTVYLYCGIANVGNVITGFNGLYSLTYVLNAGTWLLHTYFAGDFEHLDCKSSDITVVVTPPSAKKPTSLQIRVIQGPLYAGVPFTVSGTLVSDGVGVPGKYMYIYYDGSHGASPITDGNGDFSAEIIIPIEGTYTLTLAFHEDAEYLGCSVTSSPFDVLPATIPTILTIEARSSVLVDESFEVSGKLARADTGEGIPYQTIALFYDGTAIGTNTTDVNGVYIFGMSIPTAGNYTLRVEFAGEEGTLSGATASVGVRVGPAGCFIATAAYGSPLAPQLTVFRNFRDNFMIRNMVGKLLVQTYYAVSPPLADFISRHRDLRRITRSLLNRIIEPVKLLLRG